MAQRILAPVNRTGAAIVSLVAALARRDGARVRLLRVLPEPDGRGAPAGCADAFADRERERLDATAQQELEALGRSADGVAVETRVRFGDPAREIALEAEAFGADLIALASAHATGRRLFPDMADRVARRADVPVVVLESPRGDAA